MKLCPNCKAELDDQARFCVCCMTSLEEKEQISPPAPRVRQWPLVLLCLLLFGAVLFLAFSGNEPDTPPAETVPTESTATEESTEPTEAATESTESTVPDATQPQETTEPILAQVTEPARPTQPVATDPVPTTEPATEATTEPTDSATEPTETTTLGADSIYTYRRDEQGNIYITGVRIPQEDGYYEIPWRIPGHSIYGIDNYAFVGTNARVVFIDSIEWIGHMAFAGCPLTDVYFEYGMHIELDAFTGCTDLTLHVDPFYENQFGMSYSECAHLYGASWESWHSE